MNNTIRRISILTLLLGVFCQFSLAQSINVVHSGKWPPYAATDLPEQGLAIDLVNTALKRAGYTPNIQVASLDRILEGGKLGVYDVFATPWFSSERNKYLYYSKPYLESRIRFIKKKSKNFNYESFSDLNGLLVGVVRDYAYDEKFNQARGVLKLTERNLIQNLLKLNQGRIDLTLDDELVLQYEINQYIPDSMPSLEMLPKPLVVRGIHIGISRENPDHKKIATAFNKAIADMKKDGTYAKIVSKHHEYIKKPVQ